MSFSEDAMASATASASRQPDSGRGVYRQVLTHEPLHLNARFRLAVLCQLQGRMVEAVEHYRQLLQMQPDSGRAQNNLGLALASLGQHGDALAYCQRAVELQPGCADFNNLGTVQNTPSAAARMLAEHISVPVNLKPNYAAAWNNLGKRSFSRIGLWKQFIPFNKHSAWRRTIPSSLATSAVHCCTRARRSRRRTVFAMLYASGQITPRPGTILRCA